MVSTATYRIIRREVTFLAISSVASVVQGFIMCPRCNGVSEYALVASFNLALYILLWRGNALLAEYLSEKLSWTEVPLKRLAVGIVTTVFYTLAAALVVILVFDNFLGMHFGSSYQPTIMIVMAGTFVISLFLHSKEFLTSWRKAALDAERFKRESVSARYENLKSQVNPDLLFESLDNLDRLVFTDEEAAVVFIKKLSEVYRYILDTRDHEVVAARREEKFLNDYFALVNAKHKGRVVLSVDALPEDLKVPPLALQMIFESALETVQIGDNNRLVFSVNVRQGRILVTHPAVFRDPVAREKYFTIVGRIADRCRFLSETPVEVTESSGSVELWFPRLTVQQE